MRFIDLIYHYKSIISNLIKSFKCFSIRLLQSFTKNIKSIKMLYKFYRNNVSHFVLYRYD